MKLLPGWLILISFLLTDVSVGQETLYNFEWFTNKDHIQGNTVKRIITDHEGTLWLATNKGLCLFDPINGRHFTHDYLNPRSIASNNLSSVYEDANGHIWITSYTGGLSRYDRHLPHNQAFTNYSYYVEGKDTIAIRMLSDVASDDNGNIWFGGQDTGLLKMEGNEGKISRVALLPDSLGPISIYTVYKTSDGDIWVGTRHHGIFCVNPSSGEVTPYNLKPWAKPWMEENGCGAFTEHRGALWFSYYDHDLCKLDLKTRALETRLLGLDANDRVYDNALSTVAINGTRVLAGHVRHGLYSYDMETGRRERIEWATLTPAEPTPDEIMHIHVDSMNNIWVGTKTKGLIRYADFQNRFATLYPFVSQHEIKHLSSFDGNWWYRTDVGIGVYSPADKKVIKTYDYGGLWVSNLAKVGRQLLLSTYDQGVWEIDDRGNRSPLPIHGETYGFRHADCGIIIADTINGTPYLWIAAWNSGLYKYNCKNKSITLIHAGDGLPDNKIICMTKDSAGGLWVGTDGYGLLHLIDKENIHFETFITKSNTHNVLPSNTIRSLVADPDGSIWVASEYLGLTQIRQQTIGYQIINFPNSHVTPWQNIHHIDQDAVGNLWLSTEDGLLFFDRQTETFLQLEPGMGIVPPPHMTMNAYMATNDSMLVMATDLGFVVGDVQDVMTKTLPPRATVRSLFVHDQDFSHLLRQPIVNLSHEQNFFTLGFSALGVFDPHAVRFSYMLDGVDKTWREVHGDFSVSYTDIGRGDYQFLVRVGDGADRWSSSITQIPIHIEGPYWQSAWFYGLLACVLFLVSFGIFRYRLNQSRKINDLQLAFNSDLQTQLALKTEEVKKQMKVIEKKHKEKLEADYQKQLSTSELKAIRAQMNPHFIFNVLSSIESYILEQDAKTASYLVQRFAQLNRLVLENSSSNHVSFAREWQALKLYTELEAVRFGHSFSYTFEILGDWDTDRCYIPPMLIQPLIENAIHHGVRQRSGHQGEISVVVSNDGKRLCFIVTDNGIGIHQQHKEKAPSYKQTSMGIATIEERLRLINLNEGKHLGTLTLIDLATIGQCGTRATLTIPFFGKSDRK